MTTKLLLPQQPVTAKGDAPSRDLVEVIQRIVQDVDLAATAASVTALDGRVTTLEGYGRRALLATRTGASSANLNFTEFNNAAYPFYQFVLENVLPGTDAVTLQMLFSTNGGLSYDNGAGNYGHAGVGASSGTPVSAAVQSDTVINLTIANDVGNAAGELGVTGVALLYHAGNAATRTRVRGELSYDNAAGNMLVWSVTGRRLANQDTDAVRFQFSSGNISSGTIRMYGLT